MKALRDDTGKPSTSRWLSLLAMLTAMLLAANHAALLWQGHAPESPMLTLYFLMASIGGKVGHKAVELRRHSDTEEQER